MRIVAIGDVGIPATGGERLIHIGDEAMFDAALRELRLRGASDIVGISSDPGDTAQRYGIRAVPRIGFDVVRGGSRLAAEERLDRVIRTARGEHGLLEPGDTAHAIIESIGSSDGVIVTGGGNLSSLWPTHVFERAAVGAIALTLGRPLVVSGQTIGPFLDPDEAALVSALLGSTRAVGVRESASRELCLRLGITEALITTTVDDASYLVTDPPDTTPTCLVTLAGHVGDADRETVDARLAELLDDIAARTGLGIVFSAHFGALDPSLSRGDSVVHERVANLMTRPSSVAAPVDSETSARLARAASLVVTSRYHPAVFAVSAGVPTIGIPVDDYTTVKLTGALGNFGQHSLLPIADLVAGAGPAVAAEVWASRVETRQRGESIAAEARLSSTRWWDTVAAALGGDHRSTRP